jgi:hypothetical protein
MEKTINEVFMISLGVWTMAAVAWSLIEIIA